MKRHLCLVCDALAGMTILHFGAFAETAKPSATATPPLSSPQHHSNQTDKARRKPRRIATMNGEPIKKQ
jgi:hypothetical protein